MELISGVETGNRIPYDEYNVRGITHVLTYIKDNIDKTFPAEANFCM